MSASPKTKTIGLSEFIILMALLMSLVALAIDAILPAFHVIGDHFSVYETNRLQWIVGILLLGLGIGQLIYGPLSDHYGRKPLIYLGLAIFVIGSLLSGMAQTFDIMLIGRFLQGFGVAAPRILTIALVRDQYEGREMAKIMSFVISVFIIVPALAPALGAGILWVADWTYIYFSFAVMGVVSLVWLKVRQPETHPVEKRMAFSFCRITGALKEVLTHPRSMAYMGIAGLGFGCLITYLNTSKLLYYDLYGIDEMFPLYFAILALAIGAASIVNAKLVMRFGMRPLMRVALSAMIFLCGSFVLYLSFINPTPSLELFMGVMILIFFSMGILFGNANAMAMEPMGHIAGVASSVIGAGTTFISMSLGTLIGQQYDQSLKPLILGYLILALLGYIIMILVERKSS